MSGMRPILKYSPCSSSQSIPHVSSSNCGITHFSAAQFSPHRCLVARLVGRLQVRFLVLCCSAGGGGGASSSGSINSGGPCFPLSVVALESGRVPLWPVRFAWPCAGERHGNKRPRTPATVPTPVSRSSNSCRQEFRTPVGKGSNSCRQEFEFLSARL